MNEIGKYETCNCTSLKRVQRGHVGISAPACFLLKIFIESLIIHTFTFTVILIQ